MSEQTPSVPRELQELLAIRKPARSHRIPYGDTRDGKTTCPKCGRPVKLTGRGGWKHVEAA